MKKLILNNLKAEQLKKAQLKEVFGGYQCSDYYCEHVNPNATCCGGCSGSTGDPGNGNTGNTGYQCSSYYCTFINPNATCCY